MAWFRFCFKEKSPENREDQERLESAGLTNKTKTERRNFRFRDLICRSRSADGVSVYLACRFGCDTQLLLLTFAATFFTFEALGDKCIPNVNVSYRDEIFTLNDLEHEGSQMRRHN